MAKLARVGLPLVLIIALGLFVAALAGETEVVPDTDPSTPGKYGIITALTAALVVGWAGGAGVERWWSESRFPDEPLVSLALEVVPRLLLGLVLFFIIAFIASGFEALGVGLGGR